MRIDSRERGQGTTEYFLIIALGLIIILGAMYLFRNTIAGTTRQMTDAVSGEKTQSAAPDDASSTAASDTSQSQGDSDSPGSRDRTESKERAVVDASSAEEEDDSGEDEQARIDANDDGSSGGSARGQGAPRVTPRGATIVVLVVIAGVLVLVVGYFLTSSSR